MSRKNLAIERMDRKQLLATRRKLLHLNITEMLHGPYDRDVWRRRCVLVEEINGELEMRGLQLQLDAN